jgi:hypothetical protein
MPGRAHLSAAPATSRPSVLVESRGPSPLLMSLKWLDAVPQSDQRLTHDEPHLQAEQSSRTARIVHDVVRHLAARSSLCKALCAIFATTFPVPFSLFWVQKGTTGVMRLVPAAVALITGTAIGGAAFAATVTATQGQVMINRGQGYQLLVGSTEADPGTTVIVNPGGSAQVVYPDGCNLTVEPFTVHAINAVSPCEDKSATAADSSKKTLYYVIGGAAVVGGGVLAYLALTHTAVAIDP